MIKDNRKIKKEEGNEEPISEEILAVRRVSTKRVGGSSFHFSALCVAGDHNGNIGIALAKSKENINAIQKAKLKARKNMFSVKVTEEGSIPHEIRAKNGPAEIILKPAPMGAGIIAGGVIRTILEYAGIKNISAKVVGTNNPINNAYTLAEALKGIKMPEKRSEKNEKSKESVTSKF